MFGKAHYACSAWDGQQLLATLITPAQCHAQFWFNMCSSISSKITHRDCFWGSNVHPCTNTRTCTNAQIPTQPALHAHPPTHSSHMNTPAMAIFTSISTCTPTHPKTSQHQHSITHTPMHLQWQSLHPNSHAHTPKNTPTPALNHTHPCTCNGHLHIQTHNAHTTNTPTPALKHTHTHTPMHLQWPSPHPASQGQPRPAASMHRCCVAGLHSPKQPSAGTASSTVQTCEVVCCVCVSVYVCLCMCVCMSVRV